MPRNNFPCGKKKKKKKKKNASANAQSLRPGCGPGPSTWGTPPASAWPWGCGGRACLQTEKIAIAGPKGAKAFARPRFAYPSLTNAASSFDLLWRPDHSTGALKPSPDSHARARLREKKKWTSGNGPFPKRRPRVWHTAFPFR